MDAIYRGAFFVRCGNFFFRYRNYLFPLVIVPVVLDPYRVFPEGGFARERWLDLGFLMVGVAGEALRALVVGFAYIKRGGLNKRIYAEKLVTRGMFGHSRNALYVGNALMIASLILIANSVWGYLIAAPFFIFVYLSIVAAEESHLRATFGAEYDAYCRRVNRWIPNFRGFSASIEDMRFRWERVVAKEYSSVFAWVAGVLAIEAGAAFRDGGVERHPVFIGAIATAFSASVVALIAIRALKKGPWARRTAAG